MFTTEIPETIKSTLCYLLPFSFFRKNAHKLCLMWFKQYSRQVSTITSKKCKPEKSTLQHIENEILFCDISLVNISHLGSNGYVGFREKAHFVSANLVWVISVVSNKKIIMLNSKIDHKGPG